MSTSETPEGRKFHYENGKAFFYERGHRIYVQGVEIPEHAREQFDRAVCDRHVATCNQCGAWCDAPINESTPESDPDVYTQLFFAAYHRKTCGDSVSFAWYRSPARPARLPEKEWDPTACPEFLRHEQAYARLSSVECQRSLVGPWAILSPAHFCGDQFLQFEAGGAGAFHDFAQADSAPQKLRWRISEGGGLVVETPRTRETAAGIAKFFAPAGSRFELVTYTEPYGKPSDYLLVWPADGVPPLVLLHVDEAGTSPISKEWRIIKASARGEAHGVPPSVAPAWEAAGAGKQLTAWKISTSYIKVLFESVATIRQLALSQMWSVRCVRKESATTVAPAPGIINDRIGNLWVMADHLEQLFAHLRLPEGSRYACVFSGPFALTDFCGSSRILIIKPEADDSLDAPPSELRHVDLNGGPPTSLPGWIVWNPCDAVVADGSPAAHFEFFLLARWTTELMTPGKGRLFEGILASNDTGVFLNGTIEVPTAIGLEVDTRPLVAVARCGDAPNEWLPASDEGRAALGHTPFTYLEFFGCRRGLLTITPPTPGYHIASIWKERHWYRDGRRLWIENAGNAGTHIFALQEWS